MGSDSMSTDVGHQDVFPMIDLAAASHNGRELELMLQESKPLAMFYAEISELPDEALIPEDSFKPLLANQSVIRAEAIVQGPRSPKTGNRTNIKYVLFALRSEAWRMEAMLLLVEQHARTGEWNETCERMECFLLGYSDEETDAWCENRFSKHAY